jgi:alpha-beta hydrolase superfamily lysophospholipase
LTYDRIYKLNRAFTEYFVPKYADQIQKEKQDARIPGSLTTILSDGFKKGVSEGTDVALWNAVKDNDIFDWKPKTPTQLYHGTADSYVPFINSQTAYDAMQKRGATNVQLVSVAGAEHDTTIQPFFIGTLSFFDSKK